MRSRKTLPRTRPIRGCETANAVSNVDTRRKIKREDLDMRVLTPGLLHARKLYQQQLLRLRPHNDRYEKHNVPQRLRESQPQLQATIQLGLQTQKPRDLRRQRQGSKLCSNSELQQLRGSRPQGKISENLSLSCEQRLAAQKCKIYVLIKIRMVYMSMLRGPGFPAFEGTEALWKIWVSSVIT